MAVQRDPTAYEDLREVVDDCSEDSAEDLFTDSESGGQLEKIAQEAVAVLRGVGCSRIGNSLASR